ncbi:hypothetical protein Lal_00001183 [Lupinus albus]|nr:hypothetical protein Lal_00001183 [Lupinus albus]
MSDQISACNRLQEPCNRLHCVNSPKLSFLAQARISRSSETSRTDIVILKTQKSGCYRLQTMKAHSWGALILATMDGNYLPLAVNSDVVKKYYA